ncbi:hypothetical protein AU14_10965 [Marinobacter similis]|uniref:Uncharacterized protein n=1 Tax=Marinobacter similis TaxID=1420916 RepID=W5YLX2_9GAMM|nr:hypothetical protein AU14_10965 [Marinobacter similis]
MFSNHNAEHIELVLSDQFERLAPWTTQNIRALQFLAVYAALLPIGRNAKPDGIWPHHALLVQGAAAVLSINLHGA